MAMTSKERLTKAWNFEEADRVPIEFAVYQPIRNMPEAEKLLEFEANQADNLSYVAGINWGFMGIDSEYTEHEIENIPGQYRLIRRIHKTAVGEFDAITRHFDDEFDPSDYHWEKRYIETIDDFERITEAERSIRQFNQDGYNQDCRNNGSKGLPATSLFHPLGTLVRHSNMESVYAWLLTERRLTDKFLESTNNQVIKSLKQIDPTKLEDPLVFLTHALEMLTPPWFGENLFKEFVFPYDKAVNDAIHQIGGRHRAHCHGNSGQFLELFADMGIDAVEPLEPPPFGDNILSEAKEKVGNRMVLSGNIPSQDFINLSCNDVRNLVKQAIKDAAHGGGFTLRMSGGAVGVCKSREQALNDIEKGKAFIEAALEYGQY